MLDTVQKFIKSRTPATIRWLAFLFTIGVFFIRFFSKSFREKVDILNFTLFCVAILAVLRDDIKSLISKMKAVGLSGLQIPIEELEHETIEAEEKYKELIDKNTNSEEFRISNILNNKDIYQTSLNLNFKIEEQLEKIAKELKNQFNYLEDVPKTSGNVARYLIERKAVGKDIYQLVVKYNTIENKINSQLELKELTEIAIRLLRLLESIYENIKDLRIGKSKDDNMFKGTPHAMQLGGEVFEQVDEKLVALYTSVNILDSNSNSFPILQLGKDNFKIYESKNNKDFKEAELVKVAPLKGNIELRIILAIDTSGSMNKNDKLLYAKKSAISMIKEILKLKENTTLNIAIYPFNSIIRPGFINFGGNRTWSNDFIELERSINKLEADGDTPLFDALRFSIEHIKTFKGYKAVICISDGIENKSKNTKDSDLKQIGVSSKIPVYSIGYGEKAPLKFLVDFSNLTGAGKENIGSFMQVSPESLPNVMSHLTDVVSNIYGIYWKPNDLSKNAPTYYKIEINYETKSFGRIKLNFDDREYSLI